MGRSAIKLGAASVAATNIGAGTGLYACIAPSNNINFKTLTSAGSIAISTTGTEIQISGGTGGGGADGVVSGGTLNGSAQLILERTEGLGNVPDIDLSALSGSTTTAINGLSINSSGDTVLGGTLTGDTKIETSTFGLGIGIGAVACGSASFATGYVTNAFGCYSHAEGCGTCAVGSYSHAEGDETKSFNLASHAEGFRSCAIGSASHAEGSATFSHAQNSHAEGVSTQACGYASHAQGRNTISFGIFSHASGCLTHACCSTSHSSGLGFSGGAHIIAGGKTSFNHSENTSGATTGHGALANHSAN